MLFAAWSAFDVLLITDSDREPPLLEALLALDVWTPEALEAYRLLAESEHEAEATARIGRAQAELRGRAVAGRQHPPGHPEGSPAS